MSMKSVLKIICLALALLVMVQASPTARAAEIDLQRTGSVSVTLRDGNAPVPGGIFTLYHVADIAEVSGRLEYRFLEAFTGCGAELSDIHAEGLAEHLAVYASANGVTGTTKTAGANGRVTFPNLELGLYLIVQEGRPAGYYGVAPFLVSVPLEGETGWVYQVDASPKVQPQPDQPDDEKLTVKKVWRGGSDHRPESVTVQLLRDGEVFDTVVLSQENGWRYSWEGLDSSFRWTVVEAQVPEGCTVEYSTAGMTITITNTLPGKPEEPTTPERPPLIQTGQLNWPIPILAGAGMLLMVLGWLLTREKDGKCEQE